MRICIVGVGYVGLVTAACLAKLGNRVACYDIDLKKIGLLQNKKIPFYEPDLEELVSRNVSAKRLSFTDDLATALNGSTVIFIAVGTPLGANDRLDTSGVAKAAEGIARAIKAGKGGRKIIVVKSTVHTGMADILSKIMTEAGLPAKRFSVVANPEFLREGSAVSDFMRPDRVVIGSSDRKAAGIVAGLYRRLKSPIFIAHSTRCAEFIKLASNAFLATKISFANELADICETLGVDISEVSAAVGLDKRIGRQFLSAGLGYGGSCLPKDVMTLISFARENGYHTEILSAVHRINQERVNKLLNKMLKVIKSVKGKKITVLGVAFKPKTDDLREAPALKIINALRQKGAAVAAYDPVLKGRTVAGVEVAGDPYAALKGSSAAIVATEWPEFRRLDLKRVKKLMAKPVIIDGRNMFEPERLKKSGFVYLGVGR